MATNGIMWRDVNPQTDNASRLAISSLGNTANGFQALGSNINTGLDKLITRYDTIEQKNKAANTQLLLNQLHQADSLADQQNLTRMGMRNLGNVRAVLNGGEFDEKAYNAALAQWDEGVNNRFLSQDALKMSTPEGQAAYQQLVQGIARNNPQDIDKAIASGNLPMSTWGKGASAASDIRQTLLANQRYDDKLAWDRKQVEDSKKFAWQSVLTKENADKLKTIVSLKNAHGAFIAQMGEAVFTHGYNDFGEIYADLNSNNGATRAKAELAWRDIAPFANVYGLDAKSLGGLGINGLVSKAGSSQLPYNLDNTLPAQPQSNSLGSNATGSNPKPRASSFARQALDAINGSTNAVDSITRDRDTQPNPRVQAAQYAQIAALEDIIKESTGDSKFTFGYGDLGNIDKKKDPAYLSALGYYRSLSPNQRATIQNQAKRMMEEYSSAVDKDYLNANGVNVGNGEKLPRSVLTNPTLTPAQATTAERINELISKGQIDQARALFYQQYPNENKGLASITPAGSGFAWRDGIWNRYLEAHRANGGNPDTGKMLFSVLNHYQNTLPKNGDKPSDFTNSWSSNTLASNSALSAVSALSGITPEVLNQYRAEEEQQAINRRPPISLIASTFDPSNQGVNTRDILAAKGSPAERNVVARGRVIEEKNKPIEARYNFISNWKTALSEVMNQSGNENRQGYAGMNMVLLNNKTKTVTVSKSEWDRLNREAKTNEQAKAILERINHQNNNGYVKIKIK